MVDPHPPQLRSDEIAALEQNIKFSTSAEIAADIGIEERVLLNSLDGKSRLPSDVFDKIQHYIVVARASGRPANEVASVLLHGAASPERIDEVIAKLQTSPELANEVIAKLQAEEQTCAELIKTLQSRELHAAELIVMPQASAKLIADRRTSREREAEQIAKCKAIGHRAAELIAKLQTSKKL
jgi:hypothetical protein